MNLKVLNGFSRITPEDLNSSEEAIQSREQKIGFDRVYEDNEPERGALLQGKIRLTKRQRSQAKLKQLPVKAQAKSQAVQMSKPAKKKMQGYSRVNYTNEELQGLSLQGVNILQGYSLGTAQDLEEWDHLLNIEHPVILNGFQSFVLNGKAERKAKRAEKKAEKKEAKQEAKSQRPKAQKRAERKAGAQDRKQRKKEVRVAKKEEKLLKKIARREDRTAKKEGKTARKQSRIDQRTKRRELKEESKRLKAQLRSEKGGKLAQIFGENIPDVLETAVDLVRGEGDFRDLTAGDMDLPAGISDYISDAQMMEPDDVLDQREEILEEVEGFPGDEESEADTKKAGVKMSGKGMLIAGGIGLGLMAMSKKGKKGKSK